MPRYFELELLLTYQESMTGFQLHQDFFQAPTKQIDANSPLLLYESRDHCHSLPQSQSPSIQLSIHSFECFQWAEHCSLRRGRADSRDIEQRVLIPPDLLSYINDHMWLLHQR